MARTGKIPKPPAKQVLIGARVSPSFHRRIATECVRRDLTLQDLLTDALKLYFQSPVDWDRADIRFHRDAPDFSEGQAKEFNAWMDLWERYTSRMPREKIEVMLNAMEWDLRMQKSSRRKAVRRPGEEAQS